MARYIVDSRKDVPADAAGFAEIMLGPDAGKIIVFETQKEVEDNYGDESENHQVFDAPGK